MGKESRSRREALEPELRVLNGQHRLRTCGGREVGAAQVAAKKACVQRRGW